MTKRVDYGADIVRFFTDLYPLDTGRPVIPEFLATWLYTAFPGPSGDPAARNILDSRSKKQGKSALAGVVGLYMATRRRNSEVVIAAADQDQAKDRVFKSLKYAVENGPLARSAKVYRDVIELDNGSVIQAIPQDWRGASGGNYACVIFDELHVYTQEYHRRLFDELIIPPTQLAGVRWIASYAGFLGESILLREIWDRALAGQREPGELPIYRNSGAGLLALLDVGEESWRMPWSTPAYMAEIQASERPNTYRRLWLNEWVSNESEFITPEQWQACYSPDVRPLAPGDKRRAVFGADASTSRDLTALVGVVYDRPGQVVDVVYTRTWKPKPSIFRNKPTIDLTATIGQEILDLHRRGLVEAVYYDPYQLHSLALDLAKAGVRMVELPQTGSRTEADQALYDAIVSRALRHFGDPVLTEHINNAVAIETPRGFRLAKERTTRKIDAAVALSMAHFGALELQKAGGVATAIHDPFASWPLNPGDVYHPLLGYVRHLNTRPHPPGVSWENCKFRNKGCQACMEELERDGFYTQDAGAGVPMSEAAARQDFLERSGIAGRLLRQEGESRNEQQFLQSFWRNVAERRKLAGEGKDPPGGPAGAGPK